MIRSKDVFKSDFSGPIVLHMVDQTGYGDVSLAMKTAKFLMNKYPNAPIYIIGEKRSIVKIEKIDPNFLDENIYPKICVIASDSPHKRKIFDHAKLVVETAIWDDSFGKWHSENDCPKFFVGEYGLYKNDPTKEGCAYPPPIVCVSGNVGKGEHNPGILIESDLKKFSCLNPKEKTKARVDVLSRMETSLKKQVLGESEEEKFLEKNHFSFAYYNHAISYKRAAVIFAASNKKEHANFFVSVAPTSEVAKDKITLDMFQEKDFQQTLQKLGYTKIVLRSGDSEKPFKEIILDSENPNGREFRVFHREKFTHDVTLDLMRLSDVCGVAGDQSLTEAFSLGVVPIPEEWHCQIDLIKQISTTYYQKEPMRSFHANSWGHGGTCERWAKAGEILSTGREEFTTVITKFQEESNLYNSLEYKLNVAIDKPKQENITRYNQSFIESLGKYQRNLKGDKCMAFYIAAEIARYYSECQPQEPLNMDKILSTMDMYKGKKIAHISAICDIPNKNNYQGLITNERSNSFIKRHITHEPSGNAQLSATFKELHKKHFEEEDKSRSLPTTSSASESRLYEERKKVNLSSEHQSHDNYKEQKEFKNKLSQLQQRPVTEDDVALALRYLEKQEDIFALAEWFGKSIDSSYFLVRALQPLDPEKSIEENEEFTFMFDNTYNLPVVFCTMSKEQLLEFSAAQREVEDNTISL